MTVHVSLISILYIILLLCIIYILYNYIILKWCTLFGSICYDTLLKWIQVVSKDNYFMNYGYWDKPNMNLFDANKSLANLILEKSGALDKKNIKILDVGCGYGEQDFEWISKLDKSTINAVDISESQIKIASEKCKQLKLHSRLFFDTCDAMLINKKYANNEFNIILSVESAFHYSNRPLFFKGVHDVLQKDGTFVICDIVLNESYNSKIMDRLFLRIFSDFLHFPTINHIKSKEWEKSITDSGLKITESIDITDNTFDPYYKNFCNEYIKNKQLPSWITSYLCAFFKNVQPFSYKVAVCRKE